MSCLVGGMASLPLMVCLLMVAPHVAEHHHLRHATRAHAEDAFFAPHEAPNFVRGPPVEERWSLAINAWTWTPALTLSAARAPDEPAFPDPRDHMAHVHEAVVGESTGRMTKIAFVFYVGCIIYALCLFAWIANLYMRFLKIQRATHQSVHKASTEGHEQHPECHLTFHDYLIYEINWLFAWRDDTKLVLLLSVTIVWIVVGSTTYCFFTGKSLGTAVFVTFTQLIEPDGGKNATSFWGRLVCGFVSVGGLMIFALIMTLIRDRFEAALEHLADGVDPVIEANHFVVIGWSEQAAGLICELCEACTAEEGCKIAVLSRKSQKEVEGDLDRVRAEIEGHTIMVRTGKGYNRSDLKLVGAHSCKSVIILSDDAADFEGQDTLSLRVLLTLRANGWPLNGRILVNCAQAKNAALLERIGGKQCNTVNVEDFVGRILVQCSRNIGVSSVIKNTLGFSGSEFYIRPAPEQIHGLSFIDAMARFPNCVLAGIYTKRQRDSLLGVPSMERADAFSSETPSAKQGEGGRGFQWYKDLLDQRFVVNADDFVLLFADDENGLEASDGPIQELIFKPHEFSVPAGSPQGALARRTLAGSPAEPSAGASEGDGVTPGSMVARSGWTSSCAEQCGVVTEAARAQGLVSGPEVILVFGWSRTVWNVLSALNDSVAPGSKILWYSRVSEEERRAFLRQMSNYHGDGALSKLTGGIILGTGMAGCVAPIAEFLRQHARPLEQISRLFVLGETGTESAEALVPGTGRHGHHAHHSMVSSHEQRHMLGSPDMGVISTVLYVREVLQEMVREARTSGVPEPLGRQLIRVGAKHTRSRERDVLDLPIVVEVREPETELHCENVQVQDFVDSSRLSMQVLAMMAEDWRLNSMLRELTKEKPDVHFAIKDLSDYFPDEEPDFPDGINFFEIMQLGLCEGDLVIGWSVPRGDPSSRRSRVTITEQLATKAQGLGEGITSLRAEALIWDMNPLDKIGRREWFFDRDGGGADGDRVAVLCVSQA